MKTIIFASTLAATLIPFAAQAANVDLNVTGRVIPTSCIPAFAGGSEVNLGRIFSSTLDPNQQNDLPPRDIMLQISCDAPAALEIAVTDNRGPSKVPGLVFNSRRDDGLLSGQPRADGNPQSLLMRTAANPAWQVSSNGLVANTPTYSWGANALAGPAAARLHAFPMQVVAAIRPTSDLPPTNDEFDLDGSVTFDVFYL